MGKIRRMKNPEDALNKRQAAYAGDVKHQYYNLPGQYLSPYVNEIPNADGKLPRTDSTYFICYNGEKLLVNHEDESQRVDENTLKKLNNYRVNLEYFNECHVVSVISTTVPLDKCLTEYNPSPTVTFKPIIKSCPEYTSRQRLNNIKNKINNEEILTNVQAFDLIMIPRMIQENHEEVLETVCELLPRIKLEDKDFYLELVFEMDCIIHKYARTLKDIDRLEKVIGLKPIMTAREFQDKLLIEKGALEDARKFVSELGVDMVSRISGFSREELLDE